MKLPNFKLKKHLNKSFQYLAFIHEKINVLKNRETQRKGDDQRLVMTAERMIINIRKAFITTSRIKI